MKEVGNIEFIQVCGVLQRRNNLRKLLFILKGWFSINVQTKNKSQTAHLKDDDVFPGEGIVAQQIFEALGLDVELLNSLKQVKYLRKQKPLEIISPILNMTIISALISFDGESVALAPMGP